MLEHSSIRVVLQAFLPHSMADRPDFPYHRHQSSKLYSVSILGKLLCAEQATLRTFSDYFPELHESALCQAPVPSHNSL